MATHKKILHVKTKQRIREFFEDIRWLFQINNFQSCIEYPTEDSDDMAAEIVFRENYQTLTLKIYPCFFEERPEEQRKIILHELCHSITIPMNKLASEFLKGDVAVTEKTLYETMERSTSQIENILDGLLQGRMTYAKNAYKNFIKNARPKKNPKSPKRNRKKLV